MYFCAVGFKLGVREFDAALGGIGGCPFAPGAKGNLNTEKLLRSRGGAESARFDISSLRQAEKTLLKCIIHEGSE